MKQIQRWKTALRCVSTYRNMSTIAVYVLVRRLSVELIAQAYIAIYKVVEKAHARRKEKLARQKIRRSMLRQ